MPAHSRYSQLSLEQGTQLSSRSHVHALVPPKFTHESHRNNLKGGYHQSSHKRGNQVTEVRSLAHECTHIRLAMSRFCQED